MDLLHNPSLDNNPHSDKALVYHLSAITDQSLSAHGPQPAEDLLFLLNVKQYAIPVSERISETVFMLISMKQMKTEMTVCGQEESFQDAIL